MCARHGIIGGAAPVLLRAVDKDLMADDLVETLHGQVGERLKGGALVLGSGSAVLQGRCIE